MNNEQLVFRIIEAALDMNVPMVRLLANQLSRELDDVSTGERLRKLLRGEGASVKAVVLKEEE